MTPVLRLFLTLRFSLSGSGESGATPGLGWSAWVRAVGAAFLLAAGSAQTAGAADGPVPEERKGSDEPPVQVQLVGPRVLDAAPGQIATAVFRIRNAHSRIRHYQAEVDLPDGWTLVTPVSTVEVAPGEATVRLVSVSVPRRTPVGTQSLTLRLRDDKRRVLQETPVAVRVRAIRALRLQVLEAPSTVPAGEAFAVRAALTNRGNVPLDVRLDAESNRLFATRLEPDRLRLKPWETRVVTARVETEAAPSPFRHRLTLRARSAGGEPTADVLEVTRVIPVAGRDGGSGEMYPVSVRLQALGEGGTRAQRVEVEGSGPLTSDGRYAVDLFARTPASTGISGYARRDQYRLTVRAPLGTVRAGDQVYKQTPLTEPGTAGFGAGARLRRGNWSVSGHALQARRIGTGRQAAASVGVDLHPRLSLAANAIANRNRTDGSFASLRARVEPWKDARLEVEAGTGVESVPDDTGSDEGVRAELSGEHSWGSYRAAVQRVGAGAPTSTSDSERASARFVLRPMDRVTVDGAVRTLRRGLSPSSPFVYASRFARFGTRFRGEAGAARWTLALSGIDSKTSTRRRNYLELENRVRIGALGARLRVRTGQSGARERDRAPYRQVGGGVTVRKGRLFVSSGLTFTRSSLHAGGPLDEELSAYGSMRASLGARTRLQAQAQWTRARGRGFGSGQTVTASLEHTFPFGHVLSLDARSRRTGEGPFRPVDGLSDPAYQVSYRVPLGLPIVQNSEAETLAGRVVDAETGAGVGGALVRVGGHETFTSSDGRFSFSAPISPDAYLRIDRASLGLNIVPTRPLPLRIGDAARPLVIPVTTSASLTVDLVRYEHSTLRDAVRGDEPVAVGGMADVVIEARNAHGRVRRLTDGDGTARFTDLQPGTWTVKLVETALPDGMQVERDVYTVPIGRADTAAIEMRVLPATESVAMNRSVLGRSPRSGEKEAGSGGVLRRTGASGAGQHGGSREVEIRDKKNDRRKELGERVVPVTDGARAEASRRHVVREDEWLAVLARRYYNNLHLWPRIWQANRDRLANPDSIDVGTVLAIPDEASLTPEEAAARDRHLRRSAPAQSGEVSSTRRHRVESVEWLAQLSRRYYGTLACWPVIWNANREKIADPDRLEPGMHLTIPPRSVCAAAEE
jgi:hypothetical protein